VVNYPLSSYERERQGLFYALSVWRDYLENLQVQDFVAATDLSEVYFSTRFLIYHDDVLIVPYTNEEPGNEDPGVEDLLALEGAEDPDLEGLPALEPSGPGSWSWTPREPFQEEPLESEEEEVVHR